MPTPTETRLTVLTGHVVRVNQARREVEVIATSEAIDSYDTRFRFEASVEAFRRCFGNVREMHLAKAVGRIVRWWADRAQRAIHVVIRVSLGAEDTWLKVIDGTLRGASIAAMNPAWEVIDGVATCVSYDLAELSLVDNPSNPEALVLHIRGRNLMTLPQTTTPDETDDAPPAMNLSAAPDEAPTSSAATGYHALRDTALSHYRDILIACSCPDCLDDLTSLDSVPVESLRGVHSLITRRAAETETSLRHTLGVFTGELRILLDRQEKTLATQHTAITTMTSELSALKGFEQRIAQIEAQPQGGGPIALASRGVASQADLTTEELIAALTRASQNTTDPGVRLALAGEIIRLRQG